MSKESGMEGKVEHVADEFSPAGYNDSPESTQGQDGDVTSLNSTKREIVEKASRGEELYK